MWRGVTCSSSSSRTVSSGSAFILFQWYMNTLSLEQSPWFRCKLSPLVVCLSRPSSRLDTARYFYKPVGIPFLILRPHIYVSYVVLPSEGNDERADRGLSLWGTSGTIDVSI